MNSLRVAQHNNHLRLFHKNANISHIVILFLEECEGIVIEAHTSIFHILEWMLPQILSMGKGDSYDLSTMKSCTIH